jgi:hypothetical protein
VRGIGGCQQQGVVADAPDHDLVGLWEALQTLGLQISFQNAKAFGWKKLHRALRAGGCEARENHHLVLWSCFALGRYTVTRPKTAAERLSGPFAGPHLMRAGACLHYSCRTPASNPKVRGVFSRACATVCCSDFQVSPPSVDLYKPLPGR